MKQTRQSIPGAPGAGSCYGFALAMNRRDVVGGIGVLSGSAVLGALLPPGSAALAAVVRNAGQMPPFDMGRDEALGNYPAYAEPIAYGRQHLRATSVPLPADPQLFA